MGRRAALIAGAVLTLGIIGNSALAAGDARTQKPALSPSREINSKTVAAPPAAHEVAIVGARLIDGRGGPPIEDAVVVVRGASIQAAGSRAEVSVPEGAEIVNGKGLTLMPGLLDAHFHLERDLGLPALYLQHGVTSVREPGSWIEAYDPVRASGVPIPRLFLMGPHLDEFPPAWPGDARIVRDPDEARVAVDEQVRAGAMGIKVYFRLPLGTIRAIVDEAHAHGVGVTAHLEIVDARDAIKAGLDGIEHVTSFGVALAEPFEGEQFRQAILADNEAREHGRYALWSHLDIHSPRADEALGLLVSHGVFFCPTLAVFERRKGDKGTTDVEPRAFANMMAFVGRASRAGAKIVVGSHSAVPHAARGDAYAREMELLHESGLTPMQVIEAATLENARNLRVDDRLGSVEPGKQADLILVEGNPLDDLAVMRRVRGVMLNGVWVKRGKGLAP
jgi:imidazolonepropionase-like amidohydrolase